MWKSLLTRREWLVALGGLAGAATLEAMESSETYTLQSVRTAGSVDRVEIVLETGGDQRSRSEAKSASDPPKLIPLSVLAGLVYEEKALQVSADLATLRSVRQYLKAEAVVKEGEDGFKSQLDEAHGLIAMEIQGAKATAFSPRGPLSWKELELIDLPGNSLLVDRLLPGKPVTVGQSWEHSKDVMAILCGLDDIDLCDVRSTLMSVVDNAARIELSGHVEGTNLGSTTKLDLKAKYRFDLKTKRIFWFGLLIQEDSSPSPAGIGLPGLDVVARLQMKIVPQERPAHLTEDAIQGLALESTADAQQIAYRPQDNVWQLRHDRSWIVFREAKDGVTLRLHEQGVYLAQGSVSTLPQLPAGKEVTLAEFQDNLRRALGKSFGEFLKAGQHADENQCRVFRVIISGQASDVPMQWIYYLVTDRHGHQAAVALTARVEQAGRLDEVAARLLRGFRFVEGSSGPAKLAAKPEKQG